MKRLTAADINRIKAIIQKHCKVLMQILVGDTDVSPTFLQQFHVDKAIQGLVQSYYTFGKAQAGSKQDVTHMSDVELSRLVKRTMLNPAQQRAMEACKLRAQQFVDNLTQRVTSSVTTAAIQSDLTMWAAVQASVPDAITYATSRQQLASQLRAMTEDWNRDWHRVAHTELWEAKCQGEADAIMAGESPMSSRKGDTLIYKKPAPNACPKCRQLYLEKDDRTPRVFTLSELMANGNNVGRKQAEWKPTIGCVHPNCHCTMNVMPPDTAFDANGNLIYAPKVKYRPRSKDPFKAQKVGDSG